MELISDIIIYIVMACAVAGAIAAIRDDERGLGKEFKEGLYSIGPIFIPVAGIMASIPFLTKLIEMVFGPAFSIVGANPAIAATTFIAVDMGGYQLAQALATANEIINKEVWIMAMIIGYMAGATIVFSIPVGLAMLEKKDHKYMALGIMSGILSVPIGVFVSCSILAFSNPQIRELASTNADPTYTLALTFGTIFINLLPLIIIVCAIAIGLRFIPDIMIVLFLGFGRFMDAAIKLILVCCIVEHFTKFFSWCFGVWGFDPIVADTKDQLRALEVAGFIGMMLAGAFPMVYLIEKYLSKPMDSLGQKIGLESTGAAGILAAAANILAMFRLIKDMRAQDKVLAIAFAVCSAFLFGDHLAFTANFQPTLIFPVMFGKIAGGICGFILAYWLSVPKAIELENDELKGKEDTENS